MLAAATRLQDTAVALFPVALFFFIAFGGFIVRLPTLPEYLRSWAPIVSFVRWAMEVMCGSLSVGPSRSDRLRNRRIVCVVLRSAVLELALKS